MFQTMTEIGKQYGVDAKTVGKILYDLHLRDRHHAVQKGFPFEQVVTHGIAKAFAGRSGDTFYKYDIDRIREEFETAIAKLPEAATAQHSERSADAKEATAIEAKLQQMLILLNDAIASGEIGMLYRLKADIADIYALLPAQRR